MERDKVNIAHTHPFPKLPKLSLCPLIPMVKLMRYNECILNPPVKRSVRSLSKTMTTNTFDVAAVILLKSELQSVSCQRATEGKKYH